MSRAPDPIDPRWPKLLSLAVHEFRTPITVVSGYIRMLLKERAGPLSEQQRKLLEEAEKSCARLSGLVSEMSDLSSLEGGRASLNRGSVDLKSLLHEVIVGLPDLPDRTILVELRTDGASPTIDGDANRLKTALTALLTALRREVVTSDRLIVQLADGKEDSKILIAGSDQLASVAEADPHTLEPFDEWRGGSGLSLAIARRIIGQHGGRVFDPPGGGKAGAIVVVPSRS